MYRIFVRYVQIFVYLADTALSQEAPWIDHGPRTSGYLVSTE